MFFCNFNVKNLIVKIGKFLGIFINDFLFFYNIIKIFML